MIELPDQPRAAGVRPMSVWGLWLNPFAAPLMFVLAAWIAVVLVAVKISEWRACRTSRCT